MCTLHRMYGWSWRMLFACSQCSVLFGGMDQFKWKTLLVGRKKTLAIEIYKTLHSLYPSYISEIFKENSTGRHQLRSKYNLTVKRHNTVTFGRNNLRFLGPKIWDHLPREFKTAEDLKNPSEAMERSSVQL